jgi:hypothetical protein
MKPSALIVLLVIFFLSVSAKAQEDYVSSDSTLTEVSEKQCRRFAAKTAKRMDKLTARIKKTNDLYLSKFQKAEDALLHQLCGINEVSAERIMADAWYSFNRFENMSQREADEKPSMYFPKLDTLTQVTAYLNRNKSKDCNCQGLKELAASKAGLDAELKRSELIGSYIGDRKSNLQSITGKEMSLDKQLKGLYQTDFYFKQQLQDHKDLFGLQSGLENAIMGRIKSAPGFADYMAMNGDRSFTNGPMVNNAANAAGALKLEDVLASNGGANAQLLSGIMNAKNLLAKNELDIKDELKEYARQELTSNNALNEVKPEITEGADPLNKTKPTLKEKDAPKPGDFKPNPLKTKRFVDRLNYSANFQVDKRTLLFPTSGTWSMQAGYQYHTRGQMGMGANYIVAMGSSLAQLDLKGKNWIRHNGLGLRAFTDFKLKGYVYANIAWERNLRVEEGIQLTDRSTWQNSHWSNSALIGLKIIYPGSKKGRQTLELSYDLLAHNQRPALVTRVGWQF